MNTPEPSWPPAFFPSARWNAVSLQEVRECLRDWFTHSGLPDALRVDNGWPWGSKGELPPDLALWLIGLDIRMIWNPPRQPQKNGVVERSPGTAKRWAEPSRCRTSRELQQRIDEMDAIQRAEYQIQNGCTRLSLFPELLHSDRRYDRKFEKKLWRWELVADHLARHITPRQVDSKGQVTIYHRNHYVGKNYQGQMIHSSFDPTTCEWIFRDKHGHQIRTKPAAELAPATVLALQVTSRRGQTS